MNQYPTTVASGDQAEPAVQIAGVYALQERISALERELEREQEWMPYESKHNVSQSDYMELSECAAAEKLTDEQALELIARELGFDPAKVTILHSVDREEINRHHRVRTVGRIERVPLYCSSDWNYVRFDCAGRCYEFHDGELKLFYS